MKGREDPLLSHANQALTAVITTIPRPPVVTTGIFVLFMAADSYDVNGDALTCQWGLGDGITGTQASTFRSYSEPGLYAVTLMVSSRMVL